MVVSLRNIDMNSKYNFINDDFFLLLSDAGVSNIGKQQEIPELSPLSMTPSLSSIICAKRNGISSCKLSEENLSYTSSTDSESIHSISSCSSSSASSLVLSFTARSNMARSLSFAELIVDCQEHPLSESDDELSPDEQEQPELEQIALPKKPSLLQIAQGKISRSFRKLSELLISISLSTTRTQYSLVSPGFQFNERLTDDKLPASLTQEDQVVYEKELDVLETKKHTVVTCSRQRESRINSRFLRIYAHDYSLKMKGLIPFSDDELDQSLVEFLSFSVQERELLKLSMLAREKLWSNVVLSPRNDQFCHLANDVSLRFVNPSNKNWCHDNIKQDDIIGTHTSSNYQYMKKGWVDQRWVPVC